MLLSRCLSLWLHAPRKKPPTLLPMLLAPLVKLHRKPLQPTLHLPVRLLHLPVMPLLLQAMLLLPLAKPLQKRQRLLLRN